MNKKKRNTAEEAAQAKLKAPQSAETMQHEAVVVQDAWPREAPRYEKSDELRKAEADWRSRQERETQPYVSEYQGKIEQMLDEILHRGSFSYDPYSDAQYAAYEKQYRQQGQRAMEDTVGVAAGLTGGYASSYATTAGAQAYQQYLTQLQAHVPTLLQMAYERYVGEEAQQMQTLAVLQEAEAQAYAREKDERAALQAEDARAYQYMQDLYEREFAQFQAALAAWQKDRAFYAQTQPRPAGGSGAAQAGQAWVEEERSGPQDDRELLLLTLLGQALPQGRRSVVVDPITGLHMQLR